MKLASVGDGPGVAGVEAAGIEGAGVTAAGCTVVVGAGVDEDPPPPPQAVRSKAQGKIHQNFRSNRVIVFLFIGLILTMILLENKRLTDKLG